jgi:hypothetical protein
MTHGYIYIYIFEKLVNSRLFSNHYPAILSFYLRSKDLETVEVYIYDHILVLVICCLEIPEEFNFKVFRRPKICIGRGSSVRVWLGFQGKKCFQKPNMEKKKVLAKNDSASWEFVNPA